MEIDTKNGCDYNSTDSFSRNSYSDPHDCSSE